MFISIFFHIISKHYLKITGYRNIKKLILTIYTSKHYLKITGYRNIIYTYLFILFSKHYLKITGYRNGQLT